MTVKTKTLFSRHALTLRMLIMSRCLKIIPSLPSFLSPRPLSRSLCEQKTIITQLCNCYTTQRLLLPAYSRPRWERNGPYPTYLHWGSIPRPRIYDTFRTPWNARRIVDCASSRHDEWRWSLPDHHCGSMTTLLIPVVGQCRA